MKIAIISDVHNNLVNLKKILDLLKKEKINKLISCGDLASRETLDFLSDNFSGEVYHVFGNMDDDHMGDFKFVDNYKNINIYSQFGEEVFDDQKIAFTHYPDLAKNFAESQKYDFVFYGHTHKPWEESVGGCKILNPGSVTGDRFPPTFAIWETNNNNFRLVLLNEIV